MNNLNEAILKKLADEGYKLITLIPSNGNCTVYQNKEGHKIGLEYNGNGDIELVWIEICCEGILNIDQIKKIEEITNAEYIVEIRKMLRGLNLFICKETADFIDAISIEPKKFIKKSIFDWLKEFKEKYKRAELQLLEKYNLKLNDLI